MRSLHGAFPAQPGCRSPCIPPRPPLLAPPPAQPPALAPPPIKDALPAPAAANGNGTANGNGAAPAKGVARLMKPLKAFGYTVSPHLGVPPLHVAASWPWGAARAGAAARLLALCTPVGRLDLAPGPLRYIVPKTAPPPDIPPSPPTPHPPGGDPGGDAGPHGPRRRRPPGLHGQRRPPGPHEVRAPPLRPACLLISPGSARPAACWRRGPCRRHATVLLAFLPAGHASSSLAHEHLHPPTVAHPALACRSGGRGAEAGVLATDVRVPAALTRWLRLPTFLRQSRPLPALHPAPFAASGPSCCTNTSSSCSRRWGQGGLARRPCRAQFSGQADSVALPAWPHRFLFSTPSQDSPPHPPTAHPFSGHQPRHRPHPREVCHLPPLHGGPRGRHHR